MLCAVGRRPWFVCALLVSAGCFNPDSSNADTEGTETSSGTASTSVTTTGPTTSTTTDTDPTSSTAGPTTDTTTAGPTTDTETTGDDGIGGTPFSITELGDQNCAAIDTSATIQTRRGGVAVVGNNLIGHGIPLAVQVEAASLASASTVATPYAQREFVLNNLETREVFVLGTAEGPILRTTAQLGTATVVATRLFRLDPRGRLTQDPPIVLSEAITIPDGGAGAGMYHGFGEVAVFDGTNLNLIELPSGMVNGDVFSHDVAPRACDNGMHYGVLEQNFSFPQLLYFRFGEIRRQEITSSSTLVEDLSCFWTDVYGADAGFGSCSITLDVDTNNPAQSRWIVENPLVQETSTRQTLTDCQTTVDVDDVNGVFEVNPFPTYPCSGIDPSDCQVYDSTDETAGVDFGPATLAGNRILFTGTAATVSYERMASAVDEGDRTGTLLDSLVTDLEDGTTYIFAFEGDGLESAHSAGSANRLVPIDADGQPVIPQAVPLSQTVPWGAPDDVIGLFSGYGRVLVHNGTRLLDIDPSDGTVTDRGNLSVPDALACPQQAYYGVGELADGDLRLVYRQSGVDAIVRRSLRSGDVEQVASFANLADVCSIAVDPVRDVWFFSHAGPSTLSDAAGAASDVSQVLGSCGATLQTP